MVVCERIVVKESYEDPLVRYKTANYVWVWEILIGHGPVIDSNELIDIKLILFDLFLSPFGLAKVPEEPFAIIKVDKGILVSFAVLLNLLHLDVIWILSSDLLLEGEGVGL